MLYFHQNYIWLENKMLVLKTFTESLKNWGVFLNSSHGRSFTIIRTTIVGLNLNKENTGFVEWIINSGKNNGLGLFNDVLFTPRIWDLADEIKFLIN